MYVESGFFSLAFTRKDLKLKLNWWTMVSPFASMDTPPILKYIIFISMLHYSGKAGVLICMFSCLTCTATNNAVCAEISIWKPETNSAHQTSPAPTMFVNSTCNTSPKVKIVNIKKPKKCAPTWTARTNANPTSGSPMKKLMTSVFYSYH